MSELNPKTITAHIAPIKYSQFCLLCENARELPEGMQYCSTPWVCDECREAIAFLKKLKSEHDNFDPLKPILD